jgi:hypothetical protein
MALGDAWCQRSEHLGRAVRIETATASVVGRLVDLDVRLGVTLEPCGPRCSPPPLVKLPLADIRGIESFDENDADWGVGPDSGPQASRTERSTVLD